MTTLYDIKNGLICMYCQAPFLDKDCVGHERTCYECSCESDSPKTITDKETK